MQPPIVQKGRAGRIPAPTSWDGLFWWEGPPPRLATLVENPILCFQSATNLMPETQSFGSRVVGSRTTERGRSNQRFVSMPSIKSGFGKVGNVRESCTLVWRIVRRSSGYSMTATASVRWTSSSAGFSGAKARLWDLGIGAQILIGSWGHTQRFGKNDMLPWPTLFHMLSRWSCSRVRGSRSSGPACFIVSQCFVSGDMGFGLGGLSATQRQHFMG